MNTENIPWKRLGVAVPLCLGLAALVCALPMFPCGYFDAQTDIYGGYGYHSLAGAVSEGLSWESTTVPEPYEKYAGSGPFTVVAQWWIAMLYIPIFVAIGYFGYIVIESDDRKKREVIS